MRRADVENFWSLLKRALKGTYISRAVPSFVPREQAYRFNNRKLTDAARVLGLKGIINKPL